MLTRVKLHSHLTQCKKLTLLNFFNFIKLLIFKCQCMGVWWSVSPHSFKNCVSSLHCYNGAREWTPAWATALYFYLLNITAIETGFIQTLESIHSSNFSQFLSILPKLTCNHFDLQPFRDACLQGSAGFIALRNIQCGECLTKVLIDKERANDTCKVFTEAKLYDGVAPGLAVASFPAFSALQIMDEVMKILIKCFHNIITVIASVARDLLYSFWF